MRLGGGGGVRSLVRFFIESKSVVLRSTLLNNFNLCLCRFTIAKRELVDSVRPIFDLIVFSKKHNFFALTRPFLTWREVRPLDAHSSFNMLTNTLFQYINQ